MHSRPSRHIVVFISLLIFMLTGQAGVQGYVWCLGEDGHSALEYAENSTCVTALSSSKQDCHVEVAAADNDLSEADHCGPCLDIPASLEAHSFRYELHKYFDTSAELPETVWLSKSAVLLQVVTNDLLSKPPPWISQAILSHRTVVLLN
ncbi:MAG: hypothetical protein JRE63_01235 [Deltaproteobacteria bacterium]|jgi:hypothetical protein|nr:hypothetical protein [Deltaproteobacteria bacterium]